MLRVLGAIAGLVLSSPVLAQQNFGPFTVDPSIPEAILLNGGIDIRSALEFRRALAANPHATIVGLDSPGGNVQIGLLIAEEIFDRGLATYIPQAATCASACSWIFFAGRTRVVEGRLGVHQISSDVQDNYSTQVNVSDILEALNKYGTSPSVLSAMLRTPPDQMYFFSADEIERFGINRSGRPPDAAAVQEPQVSSYAPSPPDSQRAAVRFVEGVIAAHAANNDDALEEVPKFYAATVTYFGKQMSLSDVLLDKRKYFERFPARTYQVRPNSMTATCSAQVCEVSGEYSWLVTGTKTASGRAAFKYVLDMRYGASIIGESGEVIR